MNPTHNRVHINSTDTAPPPATTPADVLRCAAIYIRVHGWHQGALFQDDNARRQELLTTPPACAGGAICMAVMGSTALPTTFPQIDRVFDAQRVFVAYLETITGDLCDPDTSSGVTLADWNDEEGRTKDEVAQTLNAAADYWDARHPTGGAR